MNHEADNSRKLKRGEVKDLLLIEGARVCPAFSFLHYRNTLYSFQRISPFRSQHVFELLHIGFSLRGGLMNCSVSSTINPCRRNRHQFGTGLMNGYWDLTDLKAGFSGLPIEKSVYQHNSQVATTTFAVERMFADIRKFAIPHFDSHRLKLEKSKIVIEGLRYIDEITIDANIVRQQVEGDLKNSGGFYSSIASSTYLDLKRFLQSIPGQTREDRKLIPRTAYELLELFWCTDGL